MNLRKIKASLLALMPKAVRSILVERFRSLTDVLPDSDYSIHVRNGLYGELNLFLNPKYRIDRIWFYTHHYDLKTVLYIKRLVRKNDFFFDVGAHIGSMSFACAHHLGPQGRVFAFEPCPLRYKRLIRNVQHNARFEGIITCENYGLSDISDNARWSMAENGALKTYTSSPGNPTTPVKVTTLDEYIQAHKIESLDFIKIDVEGMELEVVLGGLCAIKKQQPLILFETNGVNESYSKIERLMRLLSELSYEFFEIDVPERELREDNSHFNFIPCEYPKLPSDTLAVPPKHRNRIRNL